MMPFGLRNIGAIYQCAMNTIFHEYLRKIIECHIDDITVKSHDKDKGDHKADLKRVFDIMRVHQLR